MPHDSCERILRLQLDLTAKFVQEASDRMIKVIGLSLLSRHNWMQTVEYETPKMLSTLVSNDGLSKRQVCFIRRCPSQMTPEVSEIPCLSPGTPINSA